MKRPHFAPLVFAAVLTLAAGPALPQVVSAQDASGVASPSVVAPSVDFHRHHRRGDRGWMKSLGLTSAQKTQIKSIMEASRAKNAHADPATRRANREATTAQIRSVLTPDQQAKFDAHMAEMRSRRESGDK